MPEEFDAIVVGAGEAGSVVASRAVTSGHRVAMVYREPYGSTCLNTGCMPSKFLIHRARIAHVTRTATRFHVEATVTRWTSARSCARRERSLPSTVVNHLRAHARRSKTGS